MWLERGVTLVDPAHTYIDTTVRIAGADIASKKLVDVSLMPAGLLDKLDDEEIADLLAYMGTLR